MATSGGRTTRNPSPGGDNDGPGALSRPGIVALDPLTGVPLSWNPGRDRGRGVEALASTPSTCSWAVTP